MAEVFEEEETCAMLTLSSHSQRTREARLLFVANRTTCGQIHGRIAANNPKRDSRNRPSESTNRSMSGSVKSNSSEITFTTANSTLLASAARATAAASMSTACAPNEARNFAFCAELATAPKLTSTPAPCPKLTLLPSPEFTTRAG
jgi:hypothetical protein